ncbi:olfactory receptor 1009-like [Sphaerodactylus townsendi]|uniref:olfactory receptor 1009-like n=1 Tax=Sphaerodactylus townsendi TaxID=933632 RepID=UPI0020274C85|nr:olfactory receptor 1009-like [Sphaerodactylus townsendi]
MENHSTIQEFIFAGFAESSNLQIPLFAFFLTIYIITLTGNLGMILLIRMNSQLHTPMYFFLSNLSFVDVCYSTVVTPKMLMDFIIKRNAISLTGCAVQMWFFGLFLATECFLLASMAYDRYMAISNPLLYTVIMSRRVCVQLVVTPYLVGVLNATTHTTLTFQLSFCNHYIINHFFCDIPAVISVSCSDTQLNNMVLFGLSCTLGIGSTSIIIVSYIYILTAILRIHSSTGRHKAFSTCSTHLTVVTIFYGTLFFTYVRPSSSSSMQEDKMVSMLYTVMIPMLNPLIYSLRNKEVKDAVRRVFRGGKLTLA